MLLREWPDSHTPVFFDFGEEQLCWLLSTTADGSAYVAPFSRTLFIEIHRSGEPQAVGYFDEFAKEVSTLVAAYESKLRPRQ